MPTFNKAQKSQDHPVTTTEEKCFSTDIIYFPVIELVKSFTICPNKTVAIMSLIEHPEAKCTYEEVPLNELTLKPRIKLELSLTI